MQPSGGRDIQKQSKSREVLDFLRRLLPRMEGIQVDGRILPLGLPSLDAHLPQRGLAFGALHEVAPEATDDVPAAFGFVSAVLTRMPESGPILLIASPRGLGRYGRPHGHGLNALGLDPARVILVDHRRRPAGPLGHGGGLALGCACSRCRRDRDSARSQDEPKAAAGSQGVRASCSCCCGRQEQRNQARLQHAGASVQPKPRATVSVSSHAGGGACGSNAAATDVQVSGWWSGIMSRIVSVWLPRWPISALHRSASTQPLVARAG